MWGVQVFGEEERAFFEGEKSPAGGGKRRAAFGSKRV